MAPHEAEVADLCPDGNDCCRELLLAIEALKIELAGVKESLSASESSLTVARTVPKLRCPLELEPILNRVFAFVGPSEWLYVAGVSRNWRGLYMSHSRLRTSMRHALVSVPRLEAACAASLPLKDSSLLWAAGRYASQDVLDCARAHGMPRLLRIK